MEIITSVDNQKVKHIKKLLDDKKYRAERGEYIAEGVRWVLDALRLTPESVAGVFCGESFLQKNPDVCGAISNLLVLTDAVFEKISATEQSQGILAVIKIDNKERGIGSQYCLFLDGIRDPGNLGTIIRTAVAAGFEDIVFFDCADIYNPKVVRSSMSALLKANLMICGCGETNLMGFLKRNGYQILAADMNGKNVFTNRVKFDKICLIIGSESDGIRPGLLALADEIVSIPMRNGIESLNAGVAAGILMYQLKSHQFND